MSKDKKAATRKWENEPTSMGSLFIDSGAHSLYNREVDDGKGATRNDRASIARKYAFFDLKKGSEFRKFLESYVAFLRKHEKDVDYYVTLDAIYNPQKTWDITVLLEEEYGLKPVPVVHCHAELKWIARYIERGHRFIGIGGLGQGITRDVFLGWGDRVFDLICSGLNRMPLVRTHGFAMTSWSLLLRYPWWSVDSASWLKAAAFGQVYVPKRRGGHFVFNEAPYVISMSVESPNNKVRGKHFTTVSTRERKITARWFEKIGVDFTEIEGATQSEKLAVRARANLLFFHYLAEELVYPRSFTCNSKPNTFGLLGDNKRPELPSDLKPQKKTTPLRVYFSGLSGGGVFPEVLIREHSPDVMLSFDNLRVETEGATAWRRFHAHRNNQGKQQ